MYEAGSMQKGNSLKQLITDKFSLDWLKFRTSLEHHPQIRFDILEHRIHMSLLFGMVL